MESPSCWVVLTLSFEGAGPPGSCGGRSGPHLSLLRQLLILLADAPGSRHLLVLGPTLRPRPLWCLARSPVPSLGSGVDTSVWSKSEEGQAHGLRLPPDLSDLMPRTFEGAGADPPKEDLMEMLVPSLERQGIQKDQVLPTVSWPPQLPETHFPRF